MPSFKKLANISLQNVEKIIIVIQLILIVALLFYILSPIRSFIREGLGAQMEETARPEEIDESVPEEDGAPISEDGIEENIVNEQEEQENASDYQETHDYADYPGWYKVFPSGGLVEKNVESTLPLGHNENMYPSGAFRSDQVLDRTTSSWSADDNKSFEIDYEYGAYNPWYDQWASVPKREL